MISAGENGWRVRPVVAPVEWGVGFAVFGAGAVLRGLHEDAKDRLRPTKQAIEKQAVGKLQSLLDGFPPNRRSDLGWVAYRKLVGQFSDQIMAEMNLSPNPELRQAIQMALRSGEDVKTVIAPLNLSPELQLKVNDMEWFIAWLLSAKEDGVNLESLQSIHERFGRFLRTGDPKYQELESALQRDAGQASRLGRCSVGSLAIGALLLLDAYWAVSSDDGRGIERIFTD